MYHGSTLWVTGFNYNPNFFGTLMIINLSYSIGLFIDSDNLVKRVIYTILTLLFLIALLLSNTTSCAVALIFIIIYLIYYCIKNKKSNALLWLLIVIINTTFIMNQFDHTTLVDDLIKTKNESVEIVKGHVDDYYGTRRIKIWKETMKIVPKNIIHGVGIDNFFYAFGDRPLIIKVYMYDKAHNEYLQILVTEGIFALISYLLFYLSIVLIGFKNSKKYNYLLLPILAYLIQAFFNISVIEIAPIFFISLGLVVDRNDTDNIIYKKYIKRLFDIIISIITLCILSPLFLIISLLIKIVDKGEVFYKQKRTGKDGKEFNILKFKTMNNKKVTNIGKFLRNSSLDELPQFINILKGDMSLVGPRPWVVDYYKKFNKKQKRRVEVRPGIIGLAQVNGRNNISIFDKIKYDLEYIDNISFVDDLKILFKSIRVIFIKENIKDMDKYINNELKELSKKNKIDK
jgi:lipopolysaccharide/colanic/teichoic acid biosynthesis glycosyltransferase